MNFPDDSPVTSTKRDELKARAARLGIELGRISESAIKAGGPGGQKVNKTSSGVLLRYDLAGELIVVKWARERQRSLNRFLALRELVDEIEFRISPQTSQRVKEMERIRKQKDRRRRR
jgi:protein subunit release factor B